MAEKYERKKQRSEVDAKSFFTSKTSTENVAKPLNETQEIKVNSSSTTSSDESSDPDVTQDIEDIVLKQVRTFLEEQGRSIIQAEMAFYLKTQKLDLEFNLSEKKDSTRQPLTKNSRFIEPPKDGQPKRQKFNNWNTKS